MLKSRIKKHNRLIKKLFFNLLNDTGSNLKDYLITFRQASKVRMGINPSIGMAKVTYNIPEVKNVFYFGLSNDYYFNRATKLNKYIKRSYKIARYFVLLHEIGHIKHFKKHGWQAFSDDYKSESFADNFAVQQLKRYHLLRATKSTFKLTPDARTPDKAYRSKAKNKLNARKV